MDGWMDRQIDIDRFWKLEQVLFQDKHFKTDKKLKAISKFYTNFGRTHHYQGMVICV